MLSVPVANSPQGLGEFDFGARPIPNARLSALGIEHDDLDCAIDALAAANTHDELILARLKKRRLRIRDEIALILADQMRAGSEAAIGAVPFQDDTETGASAPDAVSTAPPKPGAGSFAFGIFISFLVLSVLVLGWSDLTDSMNQVVAQIYVLSLLAAANG